MTQPTVSIIVTTYNRPQLLERALRSIAAQTFQDYEIIVVNDAGSDVEYILENFDKVVYINHPENRGLSAARNSGLRVAQGKYICFLDDDDVLFPVHFATLVNALESKGFDAVYTDAYWWIDEVELKNCLSRDYNRELIKKQNLFPCMSVMVRSKDISKYRFDEDLPSHEDWDMWLTLSREIVFFHIPVFTAAYSKRSNSGQMSEKDTHVYWFEKVKRKHRND